MKIKLAHVNAFRGIPLDRFNNETWQNVQECRQTVGYQTAPDWECQCLIQGPDYVKKHYPGRECLLANMLCYPCLVKEITDWEIQGVPLPTISDLASP